jgi:hypothetical protein
VQFCRSRSALQHETKVMMMMTTNPTVPGTVPGGTVPVPGRATVAACR